MNSLEYNILGLKALLKYIDNSVLKDKMKLYDYMRDVVDKKLLIK